MHFQKFGNSKILVVKKRAPTIGPPLMSPPGFGESHAQMNHGQNTIFAKPRAALPQQQNRSQSADEFNYYNSVQLASQGSSFATPLTQQAAINNGLRSGTSNSGQYIQQQLNQPQAPSQPKQQQQYSLQRSLTPKTMNQHQQLPLQNSVVRVLSANTAFSSVGSKYYASNPPISLQQLQQAY